MGIFTQIVILIMVLSCMVMVLLAIRQLIHYEGFDNSEETDRLKEEIEEDGHVMSKKNIFSNLVEMDEDIIETRNNYKKNSKEPFSRKE